MSGRPAHEALGLRFDSTALTSRAALGLGLAALWLLGRRYGGITHDAAIYLLLGLRRLEPGVLDGDLFLAHGSQDAYTAFPYIYAPLIDALGPGTAALVLTIVGQIAFLGAAAALVWRMVRGPARWWSLALLAASSGYYGGVGVFRLAETFATARTLAEPLVVLALACMLASRHRMSWFALGLAAFLHPLVAAPGIAVAGLWYAAPRPRPLWVFPLAVLAAVALGAIVPGFLARFDAPWREAVQDRSPHLFLLLWQAPDWARFIWGLCVSWLALRSLDSGARRLLIAAVVVAVAGVLASGVAVDLLDSAGAAALQMWRSHWLMHLLAIVLVPRAAAWLWRSGDAGRAAAVCLAASCCFGRSELPAAAILAAMAVVFDAAQRRRPAWISEDTSRLAMALAACAAAVGLLLEVQSRLPLAYGAARPAAWTDYVYAAGSVGGLLPLGLVIWLVACSRFRVAGTALAAAALAAAVAAWDARAPWPRFIDQASAGEHPFRAAIAPGSQVFWPAPHSPAWVLLRTPTWFSADQGAGIVFSRDTAIEYAERKRASLDLIAASENCRMAGADACRIDARRALALCRRRNAPAYLVLDARVDARALMDWALPEGVLPGARSLHLYSCTDLAAKEKGRH